MRKLTVLNFVTLDGVMQAPGGPEKERVKVQFTADGRPVTGHGSFLTASRLFSFPFPL